MGQIVAPVISNREIIPGIYLMWLEAPQIAPDAKPGQFIMVQCGDDTVLRRPISVHRVSGNNMALLYMVIGKGTQWLSQCPPDTKLDILGLCGNEFHIDADSRHIMLVAGGIGIAPLCFLADRASEQQKELTVLIGAANADQLYPARLLPENSYVIYVTEDGSTGRKGMVTDYITDLAGQADQIFACGPTGMYRSIMADRDAIRIPVQVSLEMRMGCGLGICYSCSVKTRDGIKQVCKDGPVFDINEILWNELL